MPVVHRALFGPGSPGETAVCLLSPLPCFCSYTISKSALNVAPLKWSMLRPSELLMVQPSDPDNIFHLSFLDMPLSLQLLAVAVFAVVTSLGLGSTASSQFLRYPSTTSATCTGSFAVSRSYTLVSLRLVSHCEVFLVGCPLLFSDAFLGLQTIRANALWTFSCLCPPGPSHLARLKLTPSSFLTNQRLSQVCFILKRNAAWSQLWRLSVIPPRYSLANRVPVHVSSIIKHEVLAQCPFFLYNVYIVQLALSLE